MDLTNVGEISSVDVNEIKKLFQTQQHAKNQTLQHVLSTLQTAKHTLLEALSSLPAHPYEKYQKAYLDPNTLPLKLEDVCCPEDFSSTTCSKQICAISIELNEDWNRQLCALSCCETLEEQSNLSNAFMSLSEGKFVVDRKRSADHLRFIEMVRNIPINLIEQQPYEVAKRLASQFVITYQK
jgi:hypothetical protein